MKMKLWKKNVILKKKLNYGGESLSVDKNFAKLSTRKLYLIFYDFSALFKLKFWSIFPQSTDVIDE